MTIRKANSEDLSEIAILFNQYRIFYKQASDLAAAKKFIQERLVQKDSVIFISVDKEDHIMGFTQLYPSFSSVGMQKIWILNDLFISLDHRRKGIAKGLMNYARDFCKSSGRAKLVLETGQDNVSAQRLYEELGYEREGVYLYELPMS